MLLFSLVFSLARSLSTLQRSASHATLKRQPIAQLIAPRNIERVADASNGIPIGRSRSKPCAKPEKSPEKGANCRLSV